MATTQDGDGFSREMGRDVWENYPGGDWEACDARNSPDERMWLGVTLSSLSCFPLLSPSSSSKFGNLQTNLTTSEFLQGKGRHQSLKSRTNLSGKTGIWELKSSPLELTVFILEKVLQRGP